MTKNMTEGEPARLIFAFTLPLIAGNMFQQLYAFVDTLIVGRFLGVEALAAVGCTGSLMFLMMGFVIGFSNGITIYTGQRYGAGDAKGVRQSMATCTVISIIMSVILTVFGVGLCRYLLIWMQTPPEILEGAYAFISIILGGVVMFVFLQLQTNIMRALGDSRTPTIMLAAALCVNIILEPIAILVLDGGIPGAALATVLSQLVGVLLCYIHIRRKVPALHTHREDWHITWHNMREHLRLGIPMGFQSCVIAIGAIILQVALNNLGPTAVAAFAAAQKIDAIAIMPMMSFGFAMAAYTAQNYGAQKYDRIMEGVRKCSYMSLAFSVFIAIVLSLFSRSLMLLFVGPEEQEVIAMGEQYIIVCAMCYWILAMLFIFRSTLQGLGQSVVPTIAGVMELIMRAFAAIVFCSMWGFFGVCLASPMAWLGSCVPLAIAYYWTRRSFKKQDILKA